MPRTKEVKTKTLTVKLLKCHLKLLVYEFFQELYYKLALRKVTLDSSSPCAKKKIRALSLTS